MLFSPRSLLSEIMSLGQPYHIIVFGLNSYYLIAIPFSIELKIAINNQTMLQLKKQIIEQCNSTTNLGLFKSIIEEKSYSNQLIYIN